MDAEPVKAGDNRKPGTWEKGRSGNPHGRPARKLADGRTLAELAREHTELAVDALVQIVREGESEQARVSAAEKLLDRGWGKPTQPVGLDDETRDLAAMLMERRLKAGVS
jgi:hypothetical protein